MVLTFDIDTLLISIFDNIVSNQEICHFVPTLYLQSALFFKFMTVDLFEGISFRNNLRHVLSKMVKFENSTFSGPPFCFYANFCNFCPNFVIYWWIFLMLVSKCSEKLWLYCKMSSNSTLMKTYSPACQKEKNTIFHKVHSPHSGCHSNQTMLLSYTK